MHTEGWAGPAMTHAAKYELLRIEMSAFFFFYHLPFFLSFAMWTKVVITVLR